MTTSQNKPWFEKLHKLIAYCSQDFLGGPRVLKLAHVVNFQKGGTVFWILGLMYFFDNFSIAAWVLLGLQGSYGLCWLLKDRVFPDPNWEVKVTFGGALFAFLAVLGPYWSFSYILISGIAGETYQPASLPWLGIAIFLHTLGVAIMLVADAQKYFTLALKRGLITTGIFSKMRHPNYTGEIMIYASYAIVVWHWVPWAILTYVWLILFLTNMLHKEASMSRYPEWDDYKRRTGMLLPKIF